MAAEGLEPRVAKKLAQLTKIVAQLNNQNEDLRAAADAQQAACDAKVEEVAAASLRRLEALRAEMGDAMPRWQHDELMRAQQQHTEKTQAEHVRQITAVTAKCEQMTRTQIAEIKRLAAALRSLEQRTEGQPTLQEELAAARAELAAAAVDHADELAQAKLAAENAQSTHDKQLCDLQTQLTHAKAAHDASIAQLQQVAEATEAAHLLEVQRTAAVAAEANETARAAERQSHLQLIQKQQDAHSLALAHEREQLQIEYGAVLSELRVAHENEMAAQLGKWLTEQAKSEAIWRTREQSLMLQLSDAETAISASSAEQCRQLQQLRQQLLTAQQQLRQAEQQVMEVERVWASKLQAAEAATAAALLERTQAAQHAATLQERCKNQEHALEVKAGKMAQQQLALDGLTTSSQQAVQSLSAQTQACRQLEQQLQQAIDTHTQERAAWQTELDRQLGDMQRELRHKEQELLAAQENEKQVLLQTFTQQLTSVQADATMAAEQATRTQDALRTQLSKCTAELEAAIQQIKQTQQDTETIQKEMQHSEDMRRELCQQLDGLQLNQARTAEALESDKLQSLQQQALRLEAKHAAVLAAVQAQLAEVMAAQEKLKVEHAAKIAGLCKQHEANLAKAAAERNTALVELAGDHDAALLAAIQAKDQYYTALLEAARKQQANEEAELAKRHAMALTQMQEAQQRQLEDHMRIETELQATLTSRVADGDHHNDLLRQQHQQQQQKCQKLEETLAQMRDESQAQFLEFELQRRTAQASAQAREHQLKCELEEAHRLLQREQASWEQKLLNSKNQASDEQMMGLGQAQEKAEHLLNRVNQLEAEIVEAQAETAVLRSELANKGQEILTLRREAAAELDQRLSDLKVQQQRQLETVIAGYRDQFAASKGGTDAAQEHLKAKIRIYEEELAEVERRFLDRPSRPEDEELIADLSGRVAQLEVLSSAKKQAGTDDVSRSPLVS